MKISNERNKNINMIIKYWEKKTREKNNGTNKSSILHNGVKKILSKVDKSRNGAQAYYLDIWGTFNKKG